MPMFYFHVRQRGTRYEDPQGIEMPTLEAAWEHAHRDARHIVEAGLLASSLDELWIEIGDDAGNVVATLPFRKAVTTH